MRMRAMALLLAIGATVVHAQRGSDAPTGELQIYAVDVEGGQSTLIVTPRKQSLLVDTGYASTGTFRSEPGAAAEARDARRVMEVARRAGITAIDVLLVTHFHQDHVGGVPELAQLIPIRTFVDHDTIAADADRGIPGATAAFGAYAKVRAQGRHLVPSLGEFLPVDGLRVVVVSSDAKTITTPLPGGGTSNPACRDQRLPASEARENPRSTGFRLEFGEFRFIDLGDLSGEPLYALFCPVDLLGRADVLLVPHHGGGDVADPALVGAVSPRVVLVNNGATKGGAATTLTMLHAIKGADVWQLHRSDNRGAANAPEDRLANLDESTSHAIVVRARTDGSFTVTNERTQQAGTYPAIR